MIRVSDNNVRVYMPILRCPPNCVTVYALLQDASECQIFSFDCGIEQTCFMYKTAVFMLSDDVPCEVAFIVQIICQDSHDNENQIFETNLIRTCAPCT